MNELSDPQNGVQTKKATAPIECNEMLNPKRIGKKTANTQKQNECRQIENDS